MCKHTVPIGGTSYRLSSGSNILTSCGKPIHTFSLSFFLSYLYFSNQTIEAVDSYRSTGLHSDTPQSVGLLWTRDQYDAETPT